MIPLRPHHVLCSIGFQGEGYSGPFLSNMYALVEGRLRGPDGRAERIRFSFQADAICAPCPHRVGSGCEMQERVLRFDHAHAEVLGLSEGDILTWGEAYDRAVARVKPEDLETLCSDCQWLSSGLCATALAKAKAAEQKE